MFNGVCQGAGELPYELSCGLIQKFVARAVESRENLLTFHGQLMTPATEPKGWYEEQRAGSFQKSLKMWREVDVVIGARNRPGYIDHRGEYAHLNYSGMFGKTALEVATILNGWKASEVKRDINRL